MARAEAAFRDAEAEAPNFPPLRAGLALGQALTVSGRSPGDAVSRAAAFGPEAKRFLGLIRQPELREKVRRAIATPDAD